MTHILPCECSAGKDGLQIVEAIRNLGVPMRPLSEMLEHEIANEKIRLLNLPESEQIEETENRLAEIFDWEDDFQAKMKEHADRGVKNDRTNVCRQKRLPSFQRLH